MLEIVFWAILALMILTVAAAFIVTKAKEKVRKKRATKKTHIKL